MAGTPFVVRNMKYNAGQSKGKGKGVAVANEGYTWTPGNFN